VAVSLLFHCCFVAVLLLSSEGNQQAVSKETATTQQQILDTILVSAGNSGLKFCRDVSQWIFGPRCSQQF
jgi:membrane protein involved in colicin uptake